MKKSSESPMAVRRHGGNIFPFPRPGEIVYETPPAFAWVGIDGCTQYRVEVRDENGQIICSAQTDSNVIVPDKIIPPGSYSWNVNAPGEERGWQPFSIAQNAIQFVRPTAREVLAGMPASRPRHLFNDSDIPSLCEMYAAELETLKRNIKLAIETPLPTIPAFHISGDKYGNRLHYGNHRSVCDRNLVALALGWALLKDEAAGNAGRDLLLTLCSWNPVGPFDIHEDWGDEVGQSHSRCFPAVMDLLWTKLSDKERRFVAQTLAAYAAGCEDRLKELNFHQNPGNSHAGRIPAYLGEAALSLKGTGVVDDETLERWLGYALDIYGGHFPHFGGPDGGWAEGTFYASSYTKWYLPFFSAVARFSGKNFLDRPFYQRLMHFFIHFAPPGQENHPFGDGYWCLPDHDEWPGFFAQNPFRVYSNRGGESGALALARQFSHTLRAPEIFKLHLLDVFLPPMAPPASDLAGNAQPAHAFPDGGFISLRTHVDKPEISTALLARASRYGAVSHQHADQGSFALIHRGKTLISPSGYYGWGWGTRHHFEWTRSTFAHNCLLINGEPQPWEYTSTASILSCEEKDGVLTAELDLTAAYPALTSYVRSFTLEETADCVVLKVRDRLTANKPVTVSFLNHTLSKPEIFPDGRVTVSRGCNLTITPLSGLDTAPPHMTDKFAIDVNEGIPTEFHHFVTNAPDQYHLRWEAPAAAVHDIVVEYRINDN